MKNEGYFIDYSAIMVQQGKKKSKIKMKELGRTILFEKNEQKLFS